MKKLLVFSLSTLTLCATLLTPAIANAQVPNLLLNPGFAQDTSRWTPTNAALTLNWSALDSLEQSGSGTALLSNVASAAAAQYQISQCVVLLSPAERVIASSRIRIPSAQGRTGQAFVAVKSFTNSSCTGGGTSVATNTSPTIFDTWVYSGVGNTAAGSQSVLITVEVRKNEAGETFQAYVDNVVLRVSTPTVLTIPASASIQGSNDTFFQTDLRCWARRSRGRGGRRSPIR